MKYASFTEEVKQCNLNIFDPQILENKNAASDEENYLKLKRLISINNNLLRALGVSHPVLEEIFSISESLGFGAKLTGAGAGG